MRRGSPAEHRRQSAGDAPAVDALGLVGRERLEDLLAFRVGQLVERELVVVADEVRPRRLGRHGRARGQRLRSRGAGSLRASDRYRACIDEEIELQVELAAALAAEELQLLPVGQVDLAEQRRIADPALQEPLEVAEELVRVADVDAFGRLDQERNRVDAEARDAEREPEADRLGDLVPHARVGDVQVGLVPVEDVLEVLLGALVVLPDARFLTREDRGLLLLRRFVAPHVEVAERRGAAASSGDEPRMLVGGVIDDQVDDHPHTAVLRGADHLDEVAVVAQPRIDAVEVADVVPVVAIGRRVERHEPQAGDAEIGEVVDASGKAREVADAVVVAVHVGLDVEAVDDRASSTTGRWCR